MSGVPYALDGRAILDGNPVSRGNLFFREDARQCVSESERLQVRCPGSEWCPITATTTLIGKKWHPVIVHRLLRNGASGFSELQNDVDGISSKVLSESLDDLEEKGLVARKVIDEKPVRVQYSLTDAGESLESVVMALAEWGDEYLEPAGDGTVTAD